MRKLFSHWHSCRVSSANLPLASTRLCSGDSSSHKRSSNNGNIRRSSSNSNSTYDRQDRGGADAYETYVEAMDAIALEKVASASSFFHPADGGTLVDVGMASGTSSALLARLFPRQRIIGIDVNPTMVELARRLHARDTQANLSFRVDDGEALSSLEGQRVHGFFNCSSLHHITSYNGYDANRALRALARQAALLADGGVIVVRDFVRVESRMVILDLRDDSPAASEGVVSDADLLLQFSREARSLAPAAERGFPVREVPRSSAGSGWRSFELEYADAVEFIWRKDYREDWATELQEEYGYLTQGQFERALESHGMRIVLSAPIHNHWIQRHRYVGRVRLRDAVGGEDLGFPPTNYLIAAEKVPAGRGRSLDCARHLPLLPRPYLALESYRHTVTGAIYDVARRPQPVTDILPYYRGNGNGDGRLWVYARHGYPRPLLRVRGGQPSPAEPERDTVSLDGKRRSGYITEGLAVARGGADDASLVAALADRFGFSRASLGTAPATHELFPLYFPSPGGICEGVRSVAVPLAAAPAQPHWPMPPGYSGFTESGSVRAYDAGQLLLTAQTGALAEARLEMNLYRLHARLGCPLPAWLGAAVEVQDSPRPPPSPVRSLKELLQREPSEDLFVPSETSAAFLRLQRLAFAEAGAVGSAAVLECVSPVGHSEHTVLTVPLHSHQGRLLVGMEHRELPTPQLHGRGCRLLTFPARRLPHTLRTRQALHHHLRRQYWLDGGRGVARLCALGESYYSSCGISAEQVFPFVVALTDEAVADTAAAPPLLWVPLEEALECLPLLTDGHALVALSRLGHMLQKGRGESSLQ